MSEQQHPIDYLPELALGALPDREAGPVRDHLRTCEACRAEYAELDRVAALLPFGAEDVAPRPELRDEVMARIEREPRALRPQAPVAWRWHIAAAAAGLLLLAAGATSGFLVRGGGTDGDDARLLAAVEAAAQGTLFVARGSQDGAQAAVVRAPGSMEAFLWLEFLPPLPEGKAYQAWFTRDGEAFEPSAVFRDGAGGRWAEAGSPIEEYAAMGLTIEDEGGAEAPTTAPFVVVDLTASVRLTP